MTGICTPRTVVFQLVFVFLHGHGSSGEVSGWNWIEHDSHEYAFIESPVYTWEVARQKCISQGADLVIVKTVDKRDFIVSVINDTNSKSWWIGATDRENEGQYIWVDGSTVQEKEFDFFPGLDLGDGVLNDKQPNPLSAGKQDCIELLKQFYAIEAGIPKSYTVDRHYWNDQDCTAKKIGYICEKKISNCGFDEKDCGTHYRSTVVCKSPHKRLIGNALWVERAQSITTCVTTCFKHPQCKSVNFSKSTKLCELNSKTSNYDGLDESDNFSYWDMENCDFNAS
ncbi:unnamed protein product [Owenia fusiformis]|uniref:Uncharacterized protein n=1 Tax=Owenia fusiformis TaxID=6347 RepID=A0A8J1TUB8_OWEFU|nr:unnamed protein product [Owenia fusiformis]